MAWNLARIRTYADTVVQHAGQAVVGGAKLFVGNRNIQSFQRTVKRLDEFSVSTRGKERVLMLKRWLKALNQVEYYNKGITNNEERHEETDDNTQQTMVFYQDVEHKGELLTFLDVFLHSEALEGIGLSMIHEAPNDEEVALIMEIFGHCLWGGKEVHLSILSSIQDLAKVFSTYNDEVLMKREELLQFAQSSISGLKISAEQARIDAEVTRLKPEIMKEIKIPSRKAENQTFEELEAARIQALKESLARLRVYSRMKTILLLRKDLHHGDSPEVHEQKIDKLNILSQSLAHSSSQALKRMEDHRRRREEALNFRLVKVNEVSQAEKDLLAHIAKLKDRKEELEAELKQVNSSLAAANTRLNVTREENLHFDKASNDILRHFQTKEQELLKSISMCKTETEVATTWISFIESTWNLQQNFTKQTRESISVELEKYSERYVTILVEVLPAYKYDVLMQINDFKEAAQRLLEISDSHSTSLDDKALRSAKRRQKLETEYHDLEGKVQSAFTIVENIKQLFIQSEEFYRQDEHNINDLFDDFQRVKDDFDSIERPDLRVVTPTTARWRKITKKLAHKETRERLKRMDIDQTPPEHKEKADNDQSNKHDKAPAIDDDDDSDDELMVFGSRYVTVTRDRSSKEDLNDWEV